MAVARVTVNGERVRYTTVGPAVAITLNRPDPGGRGTVDRRDATRVTRVPSAARGAKSAGRSSPRASLCANQPNGAPSWFPCDDHPVAKASYRIAISTDSPFHALANGVLTAKRTKAGQTTWV